MEANITQAAVNTASSSALIDWVNANPGTFFGMLIAAIAIIVPAIGRIISALFNKNAAELAVQLQNLSAKLEIKDATVENLRMQLMHATNKLAEVDGYRERANAEQENNQAVIVSLHKRISELESNQFFEADDKGSIRLKAVIPKQMDGSSSQNT